MGLRQGPPLSESSTTYTFTHCVWFLHKSIKTDQRFLVYLPNDTGNVGRTKLLTIRKSVSQSASQSFIQTSLGNSTRINIYIFFSPRFCCKRNHSWPTAYRCVYFKLPLSAAYNWHVVLASKRHSTYNCPETVTINYPVVWCSLCNVQTHYSWERHLCGKKYKCRWRCGLPLLQIYFRSPYEPCRHSDWLAANLRPLDPVTDSNSSAMAEDLQVSFKECGCYLKPWWQ